MLEKKIFNKISDLELTVRALLRALDEKDLEISDLRAQYTELQIDLENANKRLWEINRLANVQY